MNPTHPTAPASNATHTPTPWHVGMKPGPFIYGPQGEQIADLTGALSFNAGHNAAFIVRSCNSHAQLVAALEHIVSIAGQSVREEPKWLTQARAALQAAKE